MRIFVTGAGGQLGRDVVAAAAQAGHDVLGATRSELDITDADRVTSTISAWRPDAIIHCAAWTAVDDAEVEVDAAMAVNRDGTAHVAAAANAVDARLIAVSTDYMFAGDDRRGYDEDARVDPVNAYGATKLHGEHAARTAQRWTIARTAWVFGDTGSNFVRTIARLAAERDAIDVVDDQVGNPTWTVHLARALVECAEREIDGVLHLSGAPSVTWHGLALAIVAEMESSCVVRPVTSDAFPRPAARPACSILRVTRPETPLVGDWHDGVRAVLAADGYAAARTGASGSSATVGAE